MHRLIKYPIIIGLLFSSVVYAQTVVPLGKNGTNEYLLYSGDSLLLGTTTSDGYKFAVTGSALFSGEIYTDATGTVSNLRSFDNLATSTFAGPVHIGTLWPDTQTATTAGAPFLAIVDKRASRNPAFFQVADSSQANAGPCTLMANSNNFLEGGLPSLGSNAGANSRGVVGSWLCNSNDGFQLVNFHNEPFTYHSNTLKPWDSRFTGQFEIFRVQPMGNDNATSTIGGGGLVGIASTSPQATLAVQGTGLFSADLAAANFTATGTTKFNGIVYTWPSSQSASTCLTNDGSGALSWGACGTGSPAGNSGELQYNNGGAFGGTTGLTWDSTTNGFAFGSTSVANNLITANANIVISGTSSAGMLLASTSRTDTLRIGSLVLTKSPALGSAANVMTLETRDGFEIFRANKPGQFAVGTSTPATQCDAFGGKVAGFCVGTSTVLAKDVIFAGEPTSTIQFNRGFIVKANSPVSSSTFNSPVSILATTTIDNGSSTLAALTLNGPLKTQATYMGGGTPTASCGVVIPQSRNNAGLINIQSTVTTSCTLTFASTIGWNTISACQFSSDSISNISFGVSNGTSSVNFTSSANIGSTQVGYVCQLLAPMRESP